MAALIEERSGASDLEQVNALLSLEQLSALSIRGVPLHALLQAGLESIEERAILKRGLAFLRRRKYAEAAEWWLLNRRKSHITKARLHCLLTLLLALTYEWSGDTARARSTTEEALQIFAFVRVASDQGIQDDHEIETER
jgi:hypothetical protein